MKFTQNRQSSFNNEISIADIIHFFKFHKKIILIFVIISTILGGLYGIFTVPLYKGSALIYPAKISGDFVDNPKVILSKLAMNSFYSKETYLNCNPDFYKDKDKDNDNDYNISNLVKASISRDGELIELQIQNKNKTVIKDCLNSIFNDIAISQNSFVDFFIQSKNIELKVAEEYLKSAGEFKVKLNDKQIKELKTNDERSSVDEIYIYMMSINNKDIKEIITEINKIKTELSPALSKQSSYATPIQIKIKSFPTPKLGALIGLFLGLCLCILIAVIRQMKI